MVEPGVYSVPFWQMYWRMITEFVGFCCLLFSPPTSLLFLVLILRSSRIVLVTIIFLRWGVLLY